MVNGASTIEYGVTFRALVLDRANPALVVCLLPSPIAVAYPSLGIVRAFMRSLCRGYVPQRCGTVEAGTAPALSQEESRTRRFRRMSQ
jgi:hypothetical protein